MKFIHTADLHIGKIVCEHSMLDEQRHILARILEAVDSEKPDAVPIAGDVYDKPVPSAEAVAVLDDFLVELAARKVRTFVLSGNHDSAERIAFGGRLMEKSGVHVSQVYDGKFVPVTLSDSEGEVDVWMLPFVRPVNVRACLAGDDERDAVKDYTSAGGPCADAFYAGPQECAAGSPVRDGRGTQRVRRKRGRARQCGCYGFCRV